MVKSDIVDNPCNEVFLYQKMLDAFYDGVHITDGDGNVIYVNDAFLELLGETRENYLNNSIYKMLSRSYSSNNVTSRVIQTKKPISVVVDYYRTGKKCLVSGNPVIVNDQLVRVVAIVRDLTQLNYLQEELIKANSLALVYKDRLREIEAANNNPVINTRSKGMRNIYEKIIKISNLDTSVLLLGETGVGKDYIAKFIHSLSNRKGHFVKVNCGAIPEQLLESELFGYEPGAFTGANKNGKAGLFELAQNGTIFLDEIGDMPLVLQVKLLAAIQDKVITRLGGVKNIEIQTRIIAATNSALDKMISEKKFRKDLYYRLNVIQIVIPPLRERRDDIIPLAMSFLEEFNQLYKRSCTFSSKAVDLLLSYSWPGNIRELKNTIERAVIFSEQGYIYSEAIRDSILDDKFKTETKNEFQLGHVADKNLKKMVDNYEAYILQEELNRNEMYIDAARALGIDISTLMRKKKKYGISKELKMEKGT